MIDFSSFNFYHQSFPIKFLQKSSAEKTNMLCKIKLTEKENVFAKMFLILHAFERNICFEHPLNNLICYDLLMSLSRLFFDLRNVETVVWKYKLETWRMEIGWNRLTLSFDTHLIQTQDPFELHKQMLYHTLLWTNWITLLTITINPFLWFLFLTLWTRQPLFKEI